VFLPVSLSYVKGFAASINNIFSVYFRIESQSQKTLYRTVASLYFCRVAREQTLSKEQALQKLRQYCAYQERAHAEVKEKLYSYGLHRKEVDESIAQLIEEDYLNEERFAIQFAGGHFRLKHWGRVKIRHALKQKQISDYCIKKAMKQIDDEAYYTTLEKLASQKWLLLKGEKNIFVKKKKITGFLLQKGYESDLVNDVVKGLST
jgi:regulatory protein